MAATRIFLFGDQVDAPIPMIRRVVEKSRGSKNLQSFLQRAVDAVGIEATNFTSAERETIGSFITIQDLEESFISKRDRFGIAQLVLVFIARIGELILHAESDPSILLGDDNSTPVVTLGICGGLLPAAAAAVATNVVELIEIASFLAALTCRVAVQAARRSMQIEDGTGSWAFSAIGKIVTQLPLILDQYHRSQGVPRHRQAYFAIRSATWATVFGPPSVLRSIIDSSAALKQSDINSLPAYAAVHASHLVPPDLDKILGDGPLLKKMIKPNFKVISGSKYRPIAAFDLRELLQEAILDIFQNSTDPDRLFEAGASLLNKGQEISLFMLGNTNYLVGLKRTLNARGFKVALKTNPPALQSSEMRSSSSSIAIIGMSGQFPGSDSPEVLWESIMRRDELHKKIPADRFDADAYFDETGVAKNSITTAWGCFLDSPGHFDYKMFNVSPREAMQMNPGQRLLMHSTYEALEDAGVVTNGTRATNHKRICTFIGESSDDWRELQQPQGVDIYYLQGTQRAFTPGRIHHHFKWEGANFCVDSACGSTSSAIGMAYNALVDRECDTAIAGGSNIIANPFWQSSLSKAGFLSTTGGCKTFQEGADGYCRGEAVGVIVMKRLEDALQDNDNIISIIRGYARNHSAETHSITHPHSKTQQRLYKALLDRAGLAPNEISYVEMHGTGTVAGDSAELESVASVFAMDGSRERPLVVGAIKANIGHSEGASGISSVMKAVMIFQNEVIPPQVGMPHKMGKFASLERAQILIPAEPLPYSRQSVGQRRNIVVNNFDAAGGNSSFVLEEPPQAQIKGEDPREYHVITCSANSSTSLEQNKRRLLRLLTEENHINLANLAYTTTARRMHHSLKSAYYGRNIQDITEAMTRDLKNPQGPRKQKGKCSTVFVFTGQGAHYAGMGTDLYKSSPQFRTTITTLQSICKTHGFPSFTEVIADPNIDMESASAVQLHLSLVALELALVDLWKSWGIEPDLVIGHSIGEYAALYASGVLSANDVMYLVGKRAELIQLNCTAGTHSMLSISGTADEISALSNENLGNCEVSCFNGSGMIVLSGEQKEIWGLEVQLKERGFKCRPLEVSYGMHSRQMDAVTPDFRQIAKSVRFAAPKVGVVSTLMGDLVTDDGVFDGEYLVRQTRSPVKFQQAMTSCASKRLVGETALWLEIGPSPICLGLVRANADIHPSNALASLKRGDNNWKTVSVGLAAFYLANKPIRWNVYHRNFVGCLSLIKLPRYAFDTRDFWMTYSSNDLKLQANDSAGEDTTESPLISTCLHRLLKQKDDGSEQSATFISAISQPSLAHIIQGHKLSGIATCPAGVFNDMALTAARYLLTNGVPGARFPSLSVLNTQIYHPIVPDLDARKVVEVKILKQEQRESEFLVSFSDHGKPSAPMIANCLVRIRDEATYQGDQKKLLPSIQSKIAKLKEALDAGNADRIRGKVFYRLFSNLMDYSSTYEGVHEAIISDDFSEALAVIHLPPHEGLDFTFSPFWLDALVQPVGCLLNGNPNNPSDYIFIATYIQRMEIVAKDFSPHITYQSYAYVEQVEASDIYKGYVYIIHEGSIVGLLEGIQFRKMPRKTLHHILGKADTSQAANGHQGNGTSSTSVKPNGTLSTSIPLQNGNTSYGINGHASLNSVFLAKLIDETGMMESEMTPSMFFSEIGVDSLMSISILAAIKNKTGVELGASFLLEHPTLEEAQTALRIIENQNSGYGNGLVSVNGQNGKLETEHRECNVVLMQGPTSPSSRNPLFLIADGAGSAAAYFYLPKLGDNLPVFAVESPWVQDPENFTCSFSEAASVYLAAIRAKQPHGPYLLGGWSGGGIFAYEVARMLLETGEKVLGLIIIDITGPAEFDRTKVTMPTLSIIDHIGMLSGIDRSFSDTPQARQLKKHMFSTVRCFSKMVPIAMAPGLQPDATFVIWAKKALIPKSSNVSDDLSEVNLDAWFYPSPHDGRPDGWDLLVGDKLECFMIEGDHFSIMRSPEVESLGHIIQGAVAKCTKTVQ